MATLSAPMPEAVLWDMDGTIVDTEPYWMRAETELVTSFGGTWTHDDALAVVGSGLFHTAGVLRSRGVDLEPEQIVERLTDRMLEQLARDGVPWRPGAHDLLTELLQRGIPLALVTMSLGRMAHEVIAAMPDNPFDAVVTGDLVERPKPFPDAYLQAAEELDVPIRSTVAIEDSVSGVTSAAAAGAVTIGIPHMIPIPASDDYAVWPTLEGVGVDDLRALCDEVRA